MMFEYVEILCGMYLTFIATAMNTHNLLSAMLFKFVPLVLGLTVTLDALMRLGIV
jgi:hypothetical protein